MVIGDVLAPWDFEARRALLLDPKALGVECESYLAGIPVSLLTLTGDDRERLRELVEEALPARLPSVAA